MSWNFPSLSTSYSINFANFPLQEKTSSFLDMRSSVRPPQQVYKIEIGLSWTFSRHSSVMFHTFNPKYIISLRALSAGWFCFRENVNHTMAIGWGLTKHSTTHVVPIGFLRLFQSSPNKSSNNTSSSNQVRVYNTHSVVLSLGSF